MEEVKLPDLGRISDAQDALAKLPAQKSATDTTNWEDRHFSAPNVITDRMFDFLVPDDAVDPVLNPYLMQEARKAKFSARTDRI